MTGQEFHKKFHHEQYTDTAAAIPLEVSYYLTDEEKDNLARALSKPYAALGSKNRDWLNRLARSYTSEIAPPREESHPKVVVVIDEDGNWSALTNIDGLTVELINYGDIYECAGPMRYVLEGAEEEARATLPYEIKD